MKKKTMLGIFFAVILCILAIPLAGFAESQTNVKYIDANGKKQTCSKATLVTNSDTQWNAGWYVVEGNVNITNTVTCSGAVHLILADGCKLQVEGVEAGIRVTANNRLTIYGQSAGTGQLIATGGTGGAGIGGSYQENGYHITINGGNITAIGGSGAAGIGGGEECQGYDIIINGGNVTATGNDGGLGIGGGVEGALYDIYVKTSLLIWNNEDPDHPTPISNDGDDLISNESFYVPKVKITTPTVPYQVPEFKDPEHPEKGLTWSTAYCKNFVLLSELSADELKNLTAGWYVLDKDISVKRVVGVEAGVKIILMDGCKFTVYDNNFNRIPAIKGTGSISFYGQENGTGQIEAKNFDDCGISGFENGSEINFYGGQITATSFSKTGFGIGYYNDVINIYGGNITAKAESFGAGISSAENTCVNIYGGTVTAKNSGNAAGIGAGNPSSVGGEPNDVSDIHIYGGTIHATGGAYSAAIGGTQNSKVSNIHIEGGTVIAQGGSDGAGIGSGYKGSLDGLYITGGDITATGGEEGAGIGGSYQSDVKNVFITGGNITTQGGSNAAGIGAGKEGQASEIHISGGKIETNGGAKGAGIGAGHQGTIDGLYFSGGDITATGGEEGAGIGGSYQAVVKNVKISGGDITAQGGSNAAGIGGGKEGKASAIYISGGNIETTGGGKGAGIGAGHKGTIDGLYISGGDITATGVEEGAGIGAAYQGTVNNINITGGKVIAYGGSDAAGIGGGKNSSASNITIRNGIVTARGGSNGAGIGGGKEGYGDQITITKSFVDAKGGSKGPAIGTGYSCGSGTCDIEISDSMVMCYSVEGGGYPAIGLGPKSNSKVTCSIIVSGTGNKILNLNTGDEIIKNTGENLAGKLGNSSLLITNGTIVPGGITTKAVEYSSSIKASDKAYLETLMGKFDIQAMGGFNIMESQYETVKNILDYTDEEMLNIVKDPDQHISLSLVIEVTVIGFDRGYFPQLEYALKTVGTAKHYDQNGIIKEEKKVFTPTDFETAKGILQVTMPVPGGYRVDVLAHTSDDGKEIYKKYEKNSKDLTEDEENQTVTFYIEHCSHLKATFEPKTTSPATGVEGSDTLVLVLSVFAISALCACIILLGRKRSCK